MRLAHAIFRPSFHIEGVRITRKIRKLVLLHNHSTLIQKKQQEHVFVITFTGLQ